MKLVVSLVLSARTTVRLPLVSYVGVHKFIEHVVHDDTLDIREINNKQKEQVYDIDFSGIDPDVYVDWGLPSGSIFKRMRADATLKLSFNPVYIPGNKQVKYNVTLWSLLPRSEPQSAIVIWRYNDLSNEIFSVDVETSPEDDGIINRSFDMF